MLRFLLAGLLTVGALVLLLIGSSGDPMGTLQDLGATLAITAPPVRQAPASLRQADQPAPAAQSAPAPAPQLQASQDASPPAVSSAQPPQPPAIDTHERDALAQQLSQMRDQLATATQQVTALRTQADQEQQDLQKLQQQRASEQQNLDQAKLGRADEAAARAKRADELTRQAADQQATLQRLQAQSQQAATAGKQQQAALQQQIAAQQAQLDRLKADTALAEAQHQRQLAEASNHPAQPKDEIVPSHLQPQEQAPAPVQPAPQKLASASAPKPASATKAIEPDDRQQVLQRLRHEAVSTKPNVAPAPTETAAQSSPPPPEPMGPPPQERLLEARNAAAAGHIDEARHLLQQAQVQLVLRPVSPWQNAPAGGSVAAGQVAEALSMLDAGDLPHAIQYINLAVAQAGWPREITASSASPPGQGAYYPR